MKILLIALFLAILWFGFSLPVIIRACVRKTSDEIVYANRPATEKRINRCISILTWSNNWITNRTEQDQKRIDRLRDMLKKMQNPHG